MLNVGYSEEWKQQNLVASLRLDLTRYFLVNDLKEVTITTQNIRHYKHQTGVKVGSIITLITRRQYKSQADFVALFEAGLHEALKTIETTEEDFVYDQLEKMETWLDQVKNLDPGNEHKGILRRYIDFLKTKTERSIRVISGKAGNGFPGSGVGNEESNYSDFDKLLCSNANSVMSNLLQDMEVVDSEGICLITMKPGSEIGTKLFAIATIINQEKYSRRILNRQSSATEFTRLFGVKHKLKLTHRSQGKNFKKYKTDATNFLNALLKIKKK